MIPASLHNLIRTLLPLTKAAFNRSLSHTLAPVNATQFSPEQRSLNSRTFSSLTGRIEAVTSTLVKGKITLSKNYESMISLDTFEISPSRTIEPSSETASGIHLHEQPQSTPPTTTDKLPEENCTKAPSKPSKINKNDSTNAFFPPINEQLPAKSQYVCQMCNKKYSTLSSLCRHNLIHKCPTKHKCPCGYASHRADHLMQHVRNKHSPVSSVFLCPNTS